MIHTFLQQLRFTATLIGLCLALHPTQAADALPLELFFTPAELQSAVLSPSGRWLAAVVAPKGERARLVVSDLDGKEPARIVAKYGKVDVADVWWVNDEWLVFDTDDVVDRGSSWDRKGAGLLAVDRGGQRIRLLIKREWETLYPVLGSLPLEGNFHMLGLGEEGTSEIILGETRLDGTYQYAGVVPHVLDVATGRRRLLEPDAPLLDHWVFDVKGRARAGVGVKDDKLTTYWKSAADGQWQVINQRGRLESGAVPSFLGGSDELYAQHTDAQGYAVVSRLDVKTGQPTGQPFVSTPGYSSFVRVHQSRSDGAVLGLTVLTDGQNQVWLTDEMKALQARIDAALPGRVNVLQCRPCRQPEAVLVYSYSDRHPGEYLVYRAKTSKLMVVGSRRPQVDPARMARQTLHRVPARDGLDLPVWITASPVEAAGPRPAVVLVHGGPWVRGVALGWDPEAQFLASRGYVVIEPEFRGSTGYGEKHYLAGWRQWGQAMQDDVTDALRFAVQRGLVDPKRVCIAGGSYGGYAALMGLAKDPEQYRCGVAWVGVTDPRLMYTVHWSDIPRESKRHTMPQLIGDLEKDAAMLAANSPLEQAARIKSPVLLAYGGRDRRVPLEHGQRMREALRKAGNDPQWVVYDDEAHGFSRPENRLDFWRRVEAFLAGHLK